LEFRHTRLEQKVEKYEDDNFSEDQSHIFDRDERLFVIFSNPQSRIKRKQVKNTSNTVISRLLEEVGRKETLLSAQGLKELFLKKQVIVFDEGPQ
jgi:hypothetical protein